VIAQHRSGRQAVCLWEARWAVDGVAEAPFVVDAASFSERSASTPRRKTACHGFHESRQKTYPFTV
jgi:hypothetical protein